MSATRRQCVATQHSTRSKPLKGRCHGAEHAHASSRHWHACWCPCSRQGSAGFRAACTTARCCAWVCTGMCRGRGQAHQRSGTRTAARRTAPAAGSRPQCPGPWRTWAGGSREEILFRQHECSLSRGGMPARYLQGSMSIEGQLDVHGIKGIIREQSLAGWRQRARVAGCGRWGWCGRTPAALAARALSSPRSCASTPCAPDQAIRPRDLPASNCATNVS